ncbi:tail fiber assembly protein [Dickeya dadantii]|uniref:Probable tail fiber assembly protein n=2 Tax=Dickeya dadantii TaxID=204038 RepID=E0SFL3_DICD3|nr:tail fiber assembly protein [Dickeya dadantii]ADM96384.1 Probable tail fiber assembly protein [Dickeya dadantii 3937]NPE53049.1 phage tail protein [Dickeya dadantii]NPE61235.1 phage tail protein [Dickeya dadantii]NPE70802.1 phage tail protein [Dickeya dadantii]
MFYSKSNSGFYSKDVNGANIPDDAVEISDDYYQHLLNEQALGNTIIFDELAKKPIAVTPAPVSETQLAEAARRQRDNLLIASDWTQVPDAPVDQQAWRSYRAILRQVPEQTGFPHNVEWPVSPGK